VGLVKIISEVDTEVTQIDIDWVPDFKERDFPIPILERGVDVLKVPTDIAEQIFPAMARNYVARADVQYIDQLYTELQIAGTGDLISSQVSEIEDETGVYLTATAKALLVAPLVEYAQEYGIDDVFTESNNKVWRETTRTILKQAKEDPAYLEVEKQKDLNGDRTRTTAFSIIKAFYTRWCNIPPFCRRIETN